MGSMNAPQDSVGRNSQLDTVEDAVAAIARGEAVVVVDNEDRENEGDLIFAAEFATPELVAFMVPVSYTHLTLPTKRIV